MSVLDLDHLLRAEGLNVATFPDWKDPHTQGGKPYLWRNTAGPDASMWHHTATPSYTPNREKANMWVGLQHAGTERLYQDGGGRPLIVLANAWPAPISSGYGQQAVLDLAKQDIQNDNLASGPDDYKWAGNKSYWNTEVILDGTGTWIDDEIWEHLIIAAGVIHTELGFTEYRAIGHAQHTQRKPDLNDGRYPSARETMIAFRDDLRGELGMNLERWATRLRNPLDFDRMAAIKVITQDERDYWVNVPTNSPEFQDLRDAVEVRTPLWAGK